MKVNEIISIGSDDFTGGEDFYYGLSTTVGLSKLELLNKVLTSSAPITNTVYSVLYVPVRTSNRSIIIVSDRSKMSDIIRVRDFKEWSDISEKIGSDLFNTVQHYKTHSFTNDSFYTDRRTNIIWSYYDTKTKEGYINTTGKYFGDIIAGALEIYSVGPTHSESKQFPQLDKPVYQVEAISTSPDTRRSGIAQFMYKYVLLVLNGHLLAGSSQTPDGMKAWVNLSKNTDTEVTGWIRFSKNIITDTDFELFEELLEKVGMVYMGESNNYIFYEVPVSNVSDYMLDNVLSRMRLYIGDFEIPSREYDKYVNKTGLILKYIG